MITMVEVFHYVANQTCARAESARNKVNSKNIILQKFSKMKYHNYCNLIKTDLFKLKPKAQRKRKETQHQHYSKARLRMKIFV
jgi:hypothetical protein